MPEIEEVKREYKELAEREYAEILASLEDNAASGHFSQDSELYLEMLNMIHAYLSDMRGLDRDEPYFDMKPLIDFFDRQKKRETQSSNYLTGCFITALTLLGSSDNQAYLATAKFLGYSKVHCRKAHEEFNRKKPYEGDITAEQFIHLTVYGLKDFVESPEKYRKKVKTKFPKKALPPCEKGFPSEPQVRKAHKAYEQLLLLINKELETEYLLKKTR